MAAWAFSAVVASVLLSLLVQGEGCCWQCSIDCDWGAGLVSVLHPSDDFRQLFSPCFPDFDPPEVYCEWRVSASAGKVVEVYIPQLSLVGSPACELLSITLYDGENADGSSAQLARVCNGGDLHWRQYCSTGRHMVITYKSPGFLTSEGLEELYYRQVPSDSRLDCYRLGTGSTSRPEQKTTTIAEETDSDSMSSTEIGVACVGSLILLICLLVVCQLAHRRFRLRAQSAMRTGSRRDSLFTVSTGTASPAFNDSIMIRTVGRSRRRRSSASRTPWWREILDFRNEEEMSHNTVSNWHGSTVALTRPHSAEDFPTPPAYEEDAPPPYTEAESGSGGRDVTREVAVVPPEDPPSYSEAILSSPSPGVSRTVI